MSGDLIFWAPVLLLALALGIGSLGLGLLLSAWR